jgi:methyl-accepting chemotaxis protein
VLAAVADGDLEQQMTGDFEGSYAQMQTAINSTIDNLHDLIQEIAEASEQVKLGAGQVSNGSQSLSQGSTEQASSVEELSASLTELASQTKQNAGSANQASQLAVRLQVMPLMVMPRWMIWLRR